ncbi:gamma-glutamyl-gamma-aminobutyrate hydrolase [Anaerobacillus alkalidiazotrophicus]|uniref:Gamma-glutamyl-gamma-aminobutyrate hydrolase n=1 Tax=Anaerobacillus alkalidiazotrophicus TaxID=472963 RepID=A0A1S2MBK7_9BACI|nr:gamma-glutamyl-gamma-aminobutyrate hydrolase family protein [Anaerobacillus alkalidiazotrophicus]OIJ22069.1 gamma-glutamyl-gamma-aminobutyrate hydrolase [Anaerobacillus alkalidiazotrophicus]
MSRKNKPIIGITSSIENHNNIPCVQLHEKYIRSVLHGGGIPIVIPIGPQELVEVYISMCDGIILSSGEDVDPQFFNENPILQLQKTNSKRDKFEIELIKKALNEKKPILAICRGITILNVALGGSVIQDIATVNPKAIKHFQLAERSEPTHDLHLDNNSWLYQIFKTSKIRVNSMHHQAIDVLASSLKKVATSPDGFIEAVEGVDESHFVLGVQWHPEEMATVDPNMVQLFKDFISKCRSIE